MNRKSPRPIYLTSEGARKAALRAVSQSPVDGSLKVTISGAKGKSARQRGLQWLWYGDVVKAGIGGHDESHKDLLHRASKARWALPLLIRDDDHFADMYLMFHEKWSTHNHWDVKFRWFVENHVSTEKLNQAQMAEFLTAFRDWYGFELGVNLTDPEERGWKNLLEMA